MLMTKSYLTKVVMCYLTNFFLKVSRCDEYLDSFRRIEITQLTIVSLVKQSYFEMKLICN